MANKPEMILTPRSALKATRITLSAVMGELLEDVLETTMHGRWFFLTVLSSILKRDVQATDVHVVSIQADASLIRAKGTKGAKARREAVNQIRGYLLDSSTMIALFRQDTWKIIQVKGWSSGLVVSGPKVVAGLALLGKPGSGKTLEVLAGTTSARMSGFFGNCLLQMHGEEVSKVRCSVLTRQGQEAVTAKDCPGVDFAKYGMGPDLKPVHDGSVQVNVNFIMAWAYGSAWKTKGIKPIQHGTVLKTFRMAVAGKHMVKGNAFVRHDMPGDVDIYIHEENIKKDWIPSFDGLVIHTVVNHETQLRTDRQWLTMFAEAGKAVFLDYLKTFFEKFEAAVHAGPEAVKDFVGKSVECSEDEYFEDGNEFGDALAAVKILSRYPIGQFPQLASQVLNAATGGNKMSTKVALGGCPIPTEIATRAYILPDLSGFGRDGYYYPSKTTLRGYEAVCGKYLGEHAVTRSPHANPWEVRILELVKAIEERPAIGTIWVSWQCAADVLKTLGGADLDDQVGINNDPRVVKAARKLLKRPALKHDKVMVEDALRTKAEPCSPDWTQIINRNLNNLGTGRLAVIGAWAATVSRYLPVYAWIDSLKLRFGVGKEHATFEEAIGATTIKGMFVPNGTNPETVTGANYWKRFSFVRTNQVLIENADGDVVTLARMLDQLVRIRPVYNILLQPWFGEEYIDAGNGKPSGDHDIISLFNAVCGVLDETGIGEVYAFAGSGDKKVPFGLSELFMGTFNVLKLQPTEHGFYLLKGIKSYANGIVESVFHKAYDHNGYSISKCVHAAGMVRKGGSLDSVEALLPKVQKGKHEGKAIAYKMWSDDPAAGLGRTSESVSAFFRKVWRPALAYWRECGVTKHMVAALYSVVSRYYEVRQTSQYVWNVAYGQDVMAYFATIPQEKRAAAGIRAVGAIGTVNIKKAKLSAMLRNMAESDRLPSVNLPEELTPTQEQRAKAAAILYLYMGCSLADSVWVSRVGAPAVRGAELILKHRGADAAKVHPELAKHIDVFGKLAGLSEDVINATKVLAFNTVVNDRLLWEDEFGPRTAFMLEQYGEDFHSPETPANGMTTEDDQAIEAAYENSCSNAPDPSLWFTDDEPMEGK